MESKSDESLDSVLTRFFAELAPRLEMARDPGTRTRPKVGATF